MTDNLEETLRIEFERLKEKRIALLAELCYDHDGLAWDAEHSRLIDHGVEFIYECLNRQTPNFPKIAIIASGGYGRKEMAPCSDIDLTVVPLHDDDPHLDQGLRAIFRALHNTFGGILKLEIGYAFRQITDLPGLDPTTRTGLLDSRLIAGSEAAFALLMEDFWKTLPSGEFLLAKITERDHEMKRTHDTPLVVEPNLKEGAGGLRSFQCANWVRSAIGERPMRPSEAYETLLRIRNLMHLTAHRKQDLLSRSLLAEVSKQFDVNENFIIQMVLNSLIEGDREFSEMKRRLLESRFKLSPGVLAIKGEARIVNDSDAGQAAAGISIATKLNFQISSMKTSFQEKVNGSIALFACIQGEPTLRNLDKCGLLEVLLPELQRCQTRIPRDSSHKYTVFEHTLLVVRNIDQASHHQFISEVKAEISDLAPLYLAAILHDTGKTDPQETEIDHCITSAEIARKVGLRWGLEEQIIDTAAWLIQEHLTMSLFLRIRDLEHPETIAEFARIVGSIDRLNMLAVLTWADISAVGPDAFTSTQESFMKDLVHATSAVLEGDAISIPDLSEARRKQVRRLSHEKIPEAKIEEFLETLPAQYLAGTPPSTIQRHFEQVQLALGGQITFESQSRPDLNATELTVCAVDSPGLLSKILGVLYALDISVSGIRASTTNARIPVVIDTLTVNFGDRPVPSGTLHYLKSTLLDVLEGSQKIETLLKSKGKDPDRTQKVSSYRLLSGSTNILEIHAPHGRGMPYRLARLLARHKINILSAKVGQWAGSAAAAFYINPMNKSDSIEVLVKQAMGL